MLFHITRSNTHLETSLGATSAAYGGEQPSLKVPGAVGIVAITLCVGGSVEVSPQQRPPVESFRHKDHL